VQPSLFTRLAVAESELRAMKDMLAEMKVNQDELRQDRDEWRWRAERLLADLQRGAWWRWWNRAAAALETVTASFCGLLAGVQNKLSEMKENRDALRRGARAPPSRGHATHRLGTYWRRPILGP
jgi:chromosome condensin MukBEF ATPase and DNA-binding subunit MukB